MKNIHILPTDKPSRLFYNVGGALLFTNYENHNGVNIYITNSEEIKEGVDQWYLDKFLNKPRNSSGSQYGEKQNVIILTTDKELIGVQEIPEYFLIHYIVGNNPIEYVEIKEHLESIDTMKINYELIIPKQETLEEASKNPINYTKETNGYPKIQAFKDGAKWQMEISYSEEDMKSAFKVGFSIGYGSDVHAIYEKNRTCDEWFEKIKKK